MRKKIIMKQEREELDDCWYANLVKDAREIGLNNITSKMAENLKKSEWKKKIKMLIQKKIEETLAIKRNEMKKMRFQHSNIKTYIHTTSNDIIRQAMMIRLN